MICHLCHDRPATERTNQEPPHVCDECHDAIYSIRVWQREKGRTDSLEAAVTLRRYELKGRKVLR